MDTYTLLDFKLIEPPLIRENGHRLFVMEEAGATIFQLLGVILQYNRIVETLAIQVTKDPISLDELIDQLGVTKGQSILLSRKSRQCMTKRDAPALARRASRTAPSAWDNAQNRWRDAAAPPARTIVIAPPAPPPRSMLAVSETPPAPWLRAAESGPAALPASEPRGPRRVRQAYRRLAHSPAPRGRHL